MTENSIVKPSSCIVLLRWLLILNYAIVSGFFYVFLVTWSLLWPILAASAFFVGYFGVGLYVGKRKWNQVFWDAGYLRIIRGVFVSFLIYLLLPGFFLPSPDILIHLLLVGCLIWLSAFRGIYTKAE